MPNSKDQVRITTWLPKELYFSMHELTEETNESHASFTRRAVQSLIREERRNRAVTPKRRKHTITG